jgi:Icc-related predicted phosphoesterase
VPVVIRSLAPEPIHIVRYLNASRRGGTEVTRLPVVRGVALGLPDGLDALAVTSDLQGIVPDPRTREPRLLGVHVAVVLEELGFVGAIPRASRTGAILAGDLYSLPEANKRGGHGDVGEVWSAFAERFAWVAGVAGNHDDVSSVVRSEGVHLLDTEEVEVDGVRVAGVGLVIGDPSRRGRREEDEQLARIELVAERRPDLLILHEGPHGDEQQPGHQAIRAIVERFGIALTVCGHVHWEAALATTDSGQVLNVDARVVVLVRA